MWGDVWGRGQDRYVVHGFIPCSVFTASLKCLSESLTAAEFRPITLICAAVFALRELFGEFWLVWTKKIPF